MHLNRKFVVIKTIEPVDLTIIAIINYIHLITFFRANNYAILIVYSGLLVISAKILNR